MKALLAAIDNDSGSERETSPSKRKRKEADISSPNTNATQLGDLDNGKEGREDEDSDEGPIISRGRLAARLYRPQGHMSDSCESDPNNVYERIKHQLLPKATTNRLQAALPGLQLTSHGSQEKNGSSSQSENESERGRVSAQSTPGNKRSAIRAAQVPPADSDAAAQTDDGSSSDLPAEPQHNDKLKSLIARKKREARARKAEQEHEAAGRNGRSHGPLAMASSSVDPGLSGISEDSANDQVREGKLTQQARPTRKASKKALQEMNRETQRMSRNMQLAHQAKTKKKITKESFFSRFQFHSHTPASSNAVQGQSSSTVASSAPPSDKEAGSANESPPTSPLRADDTLLKLPATNMVQMLPANKEIIGIEDIEAVLPGNLFLVDRLYQKETKRVEKPRICSSNETHAQTNRMMKIKVANPPPASKPIDPSLAALDSESDLEVVPRWKPKQSLKIFDRMPAHGISEERSLQTLRTLAHLNSPGKTPASSKPVITMSELQVSLQRKARKQAAEERAARIQDLKDRGIIVQSAEERERDQAAIEDLVEKARQEAASIMQKEKGAARKGKLAGEDVNMNDLSSDEDEEFEGDDEDESDIDFSGSSDDDENYPINNSIEKDQDNAQPSNEDDGEELANPLHAELDRSRVSTPQPSNDKGGQDECNHTELDEHEQRFNTDTGHERERRRRRTTRVIEDDDDDDSMGEVGKSPASFGPIVQRPFIPGLAFSNAQAMGMTQAFAATMADLPSQPESNITDLEQDSLDFLGPIPEPNFPLYPLENSQMMVLETQPDLKQSGGGTDGLKQSSPSMEITIDFSQSQIECMAENSQDFPTATQLSEIPDPTQDVGFEKSSPIRNRFVSVPPSTVDTIILSRTRNSPPIKKKGRLHRRTSLLTSDFHMNDDASLPDTIADSTTFANAFDILKNGAQKSLKAADMFNKKESEARAMVEEQAQESEDEYAGLGGASDDESAGEEDEEVQKMIDEGDVDVDERELAAFYAYVTSFVLGNSYYVY